VKQLLNLEKRQIFMCFCYFASVMNDNAKEFVALAIFTFSGFEKFGEKCRFFRCAKGSELIDDMVGLGHFIPRYSLKAQGNRAD
jgi:hypothetical protein